MTDFLIRQGAMFLLSVGIGIALPLSYDFIRIFRRVVSHNSIFIAMEDVCFWLVCTCAVLEILHTYGEGSLHWYMAFGILLGVAGYHYTIGCILVKGTDYILYHVKKWAKNRNKLLKKNDRKGKM